MMAFNSPFSLTNKNILFCFIGIILFFVVTDYFLLNQLVTEKIIENKNFDFLSSNITDKCEFTDPLMQSALERVKSEFCRQSLKDVYCQVLEENIELENTCPDFDKTKLKKFVGCFDDSSSGFLLSGYHYNFPQTNSPDLCIQTCFRSAYELAGLKSGKHCFCGSLADLKNDLKVDDSVCRSVPCPGNSNLTCGGMKSTAVFSTGLTKIKRPMPEFVPLPDDFLTRKRVKILFILQLNGRNSRQVTRMIRTVYSPDHFYLVHVDKRQNFMFSEMKKLQNLFEKKKLSNFKVAENRFATIWGGSALLTMFLQMIKDSVSNLAWNNWDYVLNMSESDMPLLSLEELEHNLAINIGKSFLSSHGYNTAKFISKQGFLKVFHQCDDRMWSIMSRRTFPRNTRIDGGSDWVIVHRKLAEKAISNEKMTKQLLQFFSTVLLPLESFFHTLALNSDYCGNVIYKNLRLTNWNRNQGCRCAILKPVVDWCGCSPLVFRQIDSRINLEVSQSKKTFFARKFDSFITVESIEQAEKNSLRFKPKLLKKLKNEVWNSTWINNFDKKIDFEHKLRYFYEGIAKIFYKNWLDGQEFEPCGFQHLIQVWTYKKDSQALPILTILDGCENHFEFLLYRKNLTRIMPDPLIQEFQIIDAEFGTNLDLKEEVFRDVLPILNVNSKATILFHWKKNFTFPESNSTSPMVNIQWWNPKGRLVKNELVKPYNSIFGGQFAELDFQKISLENHVIPGLWSVRLPSKESDNPVFYTEFPVFPSDWNSTLFEKLAKLFFGLSDAKMMQNRNRLISVLKKICKLTQTNQEMPNLPLSKNICQEIQKEIEKIDCEMLDYHLNLPLKLSPTDAEIIVADIYSRWNQILCNIFLLTNIGTKLPLHDHQKINGFIKPLTGKFMISSFSWLKKDEENNLIKKFGNIGQKPAKFEGIKLISSKNSEIICLEHENGNIHSIEAMEPASSFFDILIPDYADRICEYYQCNEIYPIVGKIYWLQPVQIIPLMQGMFYPTIQIPEIENS